MQDRRERKLPHFALALAILILLLRTFAPRVQTPSPGHTGVIGDLSHLLAAQHQPADQLATVRSFRNADTADWGTSTVMPLLFRIDMRSKDDLNILSSASGWTVQHVLLALGMVTAIALLAVFWAVILHRRLVQQSAKMERMRDLERERRRLLEAINSEVLLDQLLLSICRSIESLVPGLTCCCAVTYSVLISKRISVGYAPERVLLEAPLTDYRGDVIGMFAAGGYDIDYLTAEEQEVVIAGAGIANLALSQRLRLDGFH